MKKIKSDVKGKFPTDLSKFAETGPNLEFQSSSKAASAPYLKKIKTPKMNDKQRFKDRVLTYFSESPSVLLGRLLNAKLTKKKPFQQPDQPFRISTRGSGVHISPMQWVIIQMNVGN